MTPETCSHHADLEKKLDSMVLKLDAIIDRLGKGDVTFATVSLRVDQIERIVYGATGLALTAIAGAVIALVVRVHP